MTTRRIIGFALLAGALMLGLAEVWQTWFPSYGSSDLTVGRLWVLASSSSLRLAQDLIQRRLWSPIWDFGVLPVLVTPAWTFFGVIGGLFIAFGRPKVAER
jgi:hypothetical protein